MAHGLPVIESRRNPQFQRWLEYARHPEDDSCPWLPVEGWKQIFDLSAHPIELLLFSDAADARLTPLLKRTREAVQIGAHLMDSISQVKTPQSVLAFFAKPTSTWQRIRPWVIYADRLQDPGNVGTLFRTAQATGLFSLVTSPETVSCFNPKVIRASASSLYSVPFIESVALAELKQRGYRLWGAVSSEGSTLFTTPFQAPCAFIVGNEGRGLDAAVLAESDSRLTIPMADQSESLNAGIAGALIMYEVYRQRALP